MKILFFVVLVAAGVILLPTQPVADFIVRHVEISGDGEDAINNLDMLVLLIKVLLSAAIAFVLLRCWRFR